MQKYTLGTPGWKQVNINGFGDRYSTFVSSLAPFGGELYAGTYRYPAELWRMAPDGSWSEVLDNGFGDSSNAGIDHLLEFGGRLYAGTANFQSDDDNCQTGHSNGAQIWRSANGTGWEQVVAGGFGDSRNAEVQRMAVFKGQIYAATWSGTEQHGLEIWRSATGNPGEWTRVVSDGFGDTNNTVLLALAEYDGQFYAGTRNASGGEVWQSPDGQTWTQVNLDGFGSADNRGVETLYAYGPYLYAGTFNQSSGGQIWRCAKCDSSDWNRVVGDGFGSVDNSAVAALQILDARLYAVTNNYTGAGMEVWRSQNGVDWERASASGFGDSNNRGPYYGNSVTVHNGRLTIGTANYANGIEIWAKTLTAEFTVTPTRGQPPLTVQFTNTSAGDYTSSQWDFGDGATSTETNPMHTYQQAGKYTVKLTVGDGTDSNTISREAAVRVGCSLYLPVLTRNYDPLMYDNFDDPTWDGAWNPAKWSQSWNPALFRVIQQLVSPSLLPPTQPEERLAHVRERHQRACRSRRVPPDAGRRLTAASSNVQVYEGKLRISSDASSIGGTRCALRPIQQQPTCGSRHHDLACPWASIRRSDAAAAHRWRASNSDVRRCRSGMAMPT